MAKCPTDGIAITSYQQTAKAYKGATQRLTVTLKPCGHEVDHIVSTQDPAASTYPGQNPEGYILTGAP